MKRNILLAVAVLSICAFLFCSTPARAEQTLTFKPSTVTILKDRNNNEFVRMVMSEAKEMNGIKYSSGTTVNAYREHVAFAKTIKPGQEVTAVVAKKDRNGTTYYTVLGFGDKKVAEKK